MIVPDVTARHGRPGQRMREGMVANCKGRVYLHANETEGGIQIQSDSHRAKSNREVVSSRRRLRPAVHRLQSPTNQHSQPPAHFLPPARRRSPSLTTQFDLPQAGPGRSGAARCAPSPTAASARSPECGCLPASRGVPRARPPGAGRGGAPPLRATRARRGSRARGTAARAGWPARPRVRLEAEEGSVSGGRQQQGAERAGVPMRSSARRSCSAWRALSRSTSSRLSCLPDSAETSSCVLG
jgi:hypothetical protein